MEFIVEFILIQSEKRIKQIGIGIITWIPNIANALSLKVFAKGSKGATPIPPPTSMISLSAISFGNPLPKGPITFISTAGYGQNYERAKSRKEPKKAGS